MMYIYKKKRLMNFFLFENVMIFYVFLCVESELK